jgi:dienelactone hydrolase
MARLSSGLECWLRTALLAACAALALTSVSAQELVRNFSAGPPSGQYAFASRTPQTFPQLLDPAGPGEPVNIVGHLFLPPGQDGAKLPAVLLVHGSGGIYSAMLDYWPRQFNAAGYAVLALDSFGPRGVRSTAEDQSQVPFAADVADAFAALRLLASHPRIDPKRIAIMGFSRGGITTWRTAIERVITAQQLPDGLRFAAHVPVYSGGCVGAFRVVVKPGVFSRAPMLWLHGDADDYALLPPCQDYAKRIGAAGTPVEFVVIPGARHKFDSDDTRLHVIRGAQRTLEGCPLELDVETLAIYDRFTGQRIARDQVAAVSKQSCAALGASVQGDLAARHQAAQAVLGFLARVLAR